MTLRKALLTAVVIFLCVEIHLHATPEIVEALLWALGVVLMLPMTRFAKSDIKEVLTAWKHPPAKGES